MRIQLSVLILIFVIMAGVHQVQAASTGKSAAMKYFTKNSKRQSATQAPSVPSGSGNLLGVAVGSLVSSKSYQWMGDDFTGWNIEAFYQRATSGYFGQGFHLEFQKFTSEEQDLSKISFLFSFTFPRRISFPVYLGVAGGPGFFLKQQEGESDFSFDYKAYLGLRLTEKNSQYFLQSGVKNHVSVLSDGQFVGWFVSSGVAYKF